MKAPSGEQERAEASVEGFKKDLGPFVVAAETTRMPMVFTDAKAPDHPIIFANDAFLKLTGYARDDLLGQAFNSILVSDADGKALAEIAAAFGGDEGNPDERYRRKDGSEFWASMFVCPVRNEAGDIVQHFVSLVDGTKHKDEQSHCKMLIDELNHRVKNTLSTVQSIVSQALRQQSDPAVIRDSIEARIFALSRSHDLLTRVNWDGAGLHDLVDSSLEPFRAMVDRPDRFIISGDNVRLPPNITLALGIAFHELATNAVKYGAFSNEQGSLALTWLTQPSAAGSRLVLRWEEKNGPEVMPPSRRGFGSQVLERGLAHELGAVVHLEYPPAGVICTIEMPAPASQNG